MWDMFGNTAGSRESETKREIQNHFCIFHHVKKVSFCKLASQVSFLICVRQLKTRKSPRWDFFWWFDFQTTWDFFAMIYFSLAIEFQLFPGQSRDLHAGHGRSSFSLRFDSCSSLWVLGHYLQLLAVQYAKLLGLGLWDWAWSAWLAIADWPGTTQFAESQGEETTRCYQWYVKSPRPFSWPLLKYSWPLSFFFQGSQSMKITSYFKQITLSNWFLHEAFTWRRE